MFMSSPLEAAALAAKRPTAGASVCFSDGSQIGIAEGGCLEEKGKVWVGFVSPRRHDFSREATARGAL